MRILCSVLLFVFLSACTTTEQANDALANKFLGQKADDFFIRYGPPAASHQLDDGRKLYLWAESKEPVYIPGTTTANVNVIGNTAWVSGWTSPGTTIDVQCQVRILVGEDGKIQQILSHKDSVGWWQLSRCNEVFG